MQMYGKWNNKEERDIAKIEGRKIVKKSSHEKALGNVLKGKNIEGKKKH